MSHITYNKFDMVPAVFASIPLLDILQQPPARASIGSRKKKQKFRYRNK